MEQNRKIILNEYLALTNKLNLTNRKMNEKTEVIFSLKIDCSGLIRLVAFTNNEKFLALASCRVGFWIEDKDSEYPNLCNFIVHIINDRMVDIKNCHSTIREALDRIFAIQEI